MASVVSPIHDWLPFVIKAPGLFDIPVRRESIGFDNLLREDIGRAGAEMREGVTNWPPATGRKVEYCGLFRGSRIATA
jgi:hypothetical protein